MTRAPHAAANLGRVRNAGGVTGLIAAASLSVLLAANGSACSITIARPQEQVHDSAIVAEGTATGEHYTFEITKVWKGTASGMVRLAGIVPTSSICDSYRPTVPGTRYLLLIESAAEEIGDRGTHVYRSSASAEPLKDATRLMEYLQHRRWVTRREVVTMLRGWRRGTIADASFAQWLAEIVPVADVDDWIELDSDEGEISPNLDAMGDLDVRINNRGEALTELACELAALREHLVPMLLRMLEAPRITPELLLSIGDAHDFDEDDFCAGRKASN